MTVLLASMLGSSGTASDLLSWNHRNTPTTNHLYAVTYGNGRFVAAAKGGIALVSTNGQFWELHHSGMQGNPIGIAYGNGLYIAISQKELFSSPDGKNWTRRPVLDPAGNRVFQALCFFKDKFVVLSPEPGRVDVMISSNFTSWRNYAAVVKGSYGDSFGFLKMHAAPNQVVAVGWHSNFTGESSGAVISSTNGVNWEVLSLIRDHVPLYEITYGNGLFVTVSEGGIFVSKDARAWQFVHPIAYQRALGYGNGVFVSIGFLYDPVYSTDGFHWKEVPNPMPGSYSDVAFGNASFVAVGRSVLQSNPLLYLEMNEPSRLTLHGPVGGACELEFLVPGCVTCTNWTVLTNLTLAASPQSVTLDLPQTNALLLKGTLRETP